MTIASAPGKIILFGEHAVVYGRPALAVPVMQVHVDVEVLDIDHAGIWLDAPGIDLHAPLETFLISVVRKGLPCRLWVRELLEGYLRMGYVDLGFEPGDYFRQSDLQVAALGWLAQQGHFERLVDKFGSGRIATLDADRMTQSPAEALSSVAKHYGLELDGTAISEIVGGPAFGKHSKSGAAFTAQDRNAEYAAARAAHGDEIGLVLEWARRVAKAAGVTLESPAPLLG